MSEPRYKFGEFVFDARRRVLKRNGAVVTLPNKASELLALLLREADSTVSKERIYQAIWGEKAVEDGNLTQTVYMLRRALSNGSPGRTMIRTVPHLGYAFVEPVTLTDDVPRRLPVVRYAAVAAVALFALFSYPLFVLLDSRASAGGEAQLPTPALKAYELGRQAWNNPTQASALRAREQFSRVVKLAPKSALGYAGLSDAYLLLWGRSKNENTRERFHNLEKAYAQRALLADPDSSEAHASNAQLIFYEMRSGAEQEFERAVSLNPKNALAHRWFGEFWIMNHRFHQAADELARSNAIQPLVPQDLFWLGVADYYAHQYGSAAEAFSEALAAGGNDPQIGLYLTLAYDASGNTGAAMRELDRMERAKRGFPDIRAVRASILACHGERAAALREIAPLVHSTAYVPVSAVSIAVTLAKTGNFTQARNWLRAHHKAPDETSIFPQFDPRLAGLELGPLPPEAV